MLNEVLVKFFARKAAWSKTNRAKQPGQRLIAQRSLVKVYSDRTKEVIRESKIKNNGGKPG